jgi:hypothetical protein
VGEEEQKSTTHRRLHLTANTSHVLYKDQSVTYF